MIRVETDKNLYRRYVSFLKENYTVKEFNMVFGENTLGKSTFIQSIIFALKGEEIYGIRKGDIVSFKELFKIHYKQKVVQAHVYLQLVNNGERVIAVRNAMNWEDPVTVLKGVELKEDSDLELLLHESTSHFFYKMRKENNLKGNETYQEFLFSFMDITPITDGEPSETDEEGTDVKMLFYIQNLMPLFIIHQGAWHDIQAINPRYGLRDVKKTAFEVLLRFIGTEVIKARYELEKLESLLKQKITSLNDIGEVISMISFKELNLIETEIERAKNEIDEHQQKIDVMEGGGTTEANHVISGIRNQFRISSQKTRRYRETMHGLETEVEEYNFYINKILNDIEKNDKLKTAKKIIGILPIDTCPHCHNTLTVDTDDELQSDTCGLCGSPFKKLTYAQNEQYLGYLKDELKDFKRLKDQKEEEKQNLYSKVVLAELEQAELKKAMNDFEEKLKPKNLQAYNFHSREIGRLQNVVIQLKKDKEIIHRYEVLLSDKTALTQDIKDKKSFIKGIEKQKEKDEEKLSYFETEFKEYLKKLDFLKLGLDEVKIKNDKKENREKKANSLEEVYAQIKIDRFDYLPKIEDRNLYYLTSSSGLIRIILSYYIALLKTALNYTDSVQHPFLLIMDEPRQQNLDIQTFNNFLSLFKELKEEYPDQFQVIIASSEKGSALFEDLSLDLGKNTLLLEPVRNEEHSTQVERKEN